MKPFEKSETVYGEIFKARVCADVLVLAYCQPPAYTNESIEKIRERLERENIDYSFYYISDNGDVYTLEELEELLNWEFDGESNVMFCNPRFYYPTIKLGIGKGIEVKRSDNY